MDVSQVLPFDNSHRCSEMLSNGSDVQEDDNKIHFVEVHYGDVSEEIKQSSDLKPTTQDSSSSKPVPKSQEKNSTKAKRGKYVKLDEWMKVKIARHAWQYGNSSAIQKYSPRIGQTIQNRMVTRLKELFEKQLAQGTPADGVTKLTGTCPRGRPLLLGTCDGEIQEYIEQMKRAGQKFTFRDIIVKAKAIMYEHNPDVLKENGGHLELGRKWVESLRRRMRSKKPDIAEGWSSDEETELKQWTRIYDNIDLGDWRTQQEKNDMKKRKAKEDTHTTDSDAEEHKKSKKTMSYTYVMNNSNTHNSPSHSKRRSRGRPLKLGHLDSKVQEHVLLMRQPGEVIKYASIISTAKDVIEQEDPKLLAENGGPLKLGQKWVRSLLGRMKNKRSKHIQEDENMPANTSMISENDHSVHVTDDQNETENEYDLNKIENHWPEISSERSSTAENANGQPEARNQIDANENNTKISDCLKGNKNVNRINEDGNRNESIAAVDQYYSNETVESNPNGIENTPNKIRNEIGRIELHCNAVDNNENTGNPNQFENAKLLNIFQNEIGRIELLSQPVETRNMNLPNRPEDMSDSNDILIQVGGIEFSCERVEDSENESTTSSVIPVLNADHSITDAGGNRDNVRVIQPDCESASATIPGENDNTEFSADVRGVLEPWNCENQGRANRYLKLDKQTQLAIGEHATKHGFKETAIKYCDKLGKRLTTNNMSYYKKLFQDQKNYDSSESKSSKRRSLPAKKSRSARSCRKSRKRTQSCSKLLDEEANQSLEGSRTISKEKISRKRRNKRNNSTLEQQPEPMVSNDLEQKQRPSLFDRFEVKQEVMTD